jgi:hypothetical protein
MTYHDNGTGRDGTARRGMSTGMIGALVLLAVLVIGGLFYGMSRDSATATNGSQATTSTTGQSRSGTSTGQNTPGANGTRSSGDNAPNPAPPAGR